MLTRNQLKNMSKDEVIEEFMKLAEINISLENLDKRFDKLESELAVSRTCSNLLNKRVIQLERDQLQTSQYLRKDSIELNPIPEEIEDGELETAICKALSLSGVQVDPTEIIATHRLRQRDRAIVKFCNRKKRNEVYNKRKDLQHKSQELKELMFKDKLYISESISAENSHLFYLYRKLKSRGIINST